MERVGIDNFNDCSSIDILYAVVIKLSRSVYVLSKSDVSYYKNPSLCLNAYSSKIHSVPFNVGRWATSQRYDFNLYVSIAFLFFRYCIVIS